VECRHGNNFYLKNADSDQKTQRCLSVVPTVTLLYHLAQKLMRCTDFLPATVPCGQMSQPRLQDGVRVAKEHQR
jgi:hypothetical protein